MNKLGIIGRLGPESTIASNVMSHSAVIGILVVLLLMSGAPVSQGGAGTGTI